MNKLKKLIIDYYTDIYKNQLSLKDYGKRVKERSREGSSECYYSPKREILLITKTINYSFKNKKVLVVGAGTGLELFTLKKIGAKVTGIEPDNSALRILKLKKNKYKYKNVIIKKAVAEKLPFKDKQFDFIYCWQVLEHVQDLKKSIEEMCRVTKKGGYLFFGFPDYRQIFEPHYKMFLPLFLPKWISKLVLIIKGRKVEYFNSLQFVTGKKVKQIARELGLLGIQIIKQKRDELIKDRGKKLVNWIQNWLEVEQSQLWLFKKS